MKQSFSRDSLHHRSLCSPRSLYSHSCGSRTKATRNQSNRSMPWVVHSGTERRQIPGFRLITLNTLYQLRKGNFFFDQLKGILDLQIGNKICHIINPYRLIISFYCSSTNYGDFKSHRTEPLVCFGLFSDLTFLFLQRR